MVNRIGQTNLCEGIDCHVAGISLKKANGPLKRFAFVNVAGFLPPLRTSGKQL